MTEGPTSPAKIDLAHEADFVLGGLRISPSACRVASGDKEERVEPRVMEVLIVLACHAGRTVTREQLIDACWGGRAVSDDAVTRVIARVRALGRETEPPHFSLETLPKVGFRLTVAARPADDALPGTGTPSNEVEDPLPADRRPAARNDGEASWWKRAGMMIGAAIVAVLALAAIWAFIQSPAPVTKAPRVAVAPINVMQTQAELHRLAGTTTAALVRSLAGAGIETSMSAQAPPNGRPEAKPQVMLAGSADFDGTAYHVNITVSDRESARALWSGSFQRESEDVRGLDEEVAYDLATILRCAFRQRKPRVADTALEVLSLFMHACEGMIGWRSEKALEATQRLVALAPAFADAHAFRAIALDRRADDLDHLGKEAQGLHEEAHAEAQKALELDPQAVAAHVALGNVMESRAEFAKSEHHHRRALEIDPENKRALDDYGLLLRQLGRLGAAHETFERISTGSGPLIHGAFWHAMNGNEAESEQLLKRLAITRGSAERGVRFAITTFWTEPSAALTRLHQFEESEGRREVLCIEAHLRTLGLPKKQVRRGLPEGCEKFAVDWKIRMLARQGDIDDAYELVRQLPNSRSYFAFLFYPEMKAFRHDKRFMPLADRLGLLRYWRETNQWPDFCAEPDVPYDCRTWTAPN